MGLTHITKRRDFKAAAATGRRFRAFACTIQLRERDTQSQDAQEQDAQGKDTQGKDPQGLRLGLTASNHTGSSPERNRIRRRLRAAAELAYASAAATPIDVVIVARREVLTAKFDKLQADLVRSLSEARVKSSTTPRQDNAKRR